MGNLGLFIKKTREERGLSQEEVAKVARLARSYISRLEDGNYKAPSVMTLIRLAKGLGVSNERIFIETGVSVRENKELPAFDVYCRTKFNLPQEAISQMQEYLNLIKHRYTVSHELSHARYADNHRQQKTIKPK